MAINQNANELHVYPVTENEFIGAMNLSLDRGSVIWPILVLDCSSAAGDVAQRFVKEVLPLLKSKVKYWYSSTQLITFGNECVEESGSITDLSKLNLKIGGDPNIGPAIEKLRSYFEKTPKNNPFSFHVITISAGEISDHKNAEREVDKLIDVVADRDSWRINSQAVRLITTTSNTPDTRALSYLLQINNSTESKICDINAASSSESIANEIAALFPENVERRSYFQPQKITFSRFPWISTSTQPNYFVFSNGWNIFWLNQLPATNEITLVSYQNRNIKITVEKQLTLEKFQQLIEKMMPQIVSQLKSLKIVDTTEANKAVNQIFSYFAKTEEALAIKCSTSNTKVVTNALAGLATYRADFRDSAEMLEFYRNHTKAIEEQAEKDRLKKLEEEERQKQAEKEKLEREEEERQQQEELRKREEEKQAEEERQQELRKQEEEDRQKQAEAEQRKREEEERQKREEKAAARKIDPLDPNSVQMVFILDKHLSGANANRHFMEKIIPSMLSKHFADSLQHVPLVTFLRYKSTAVETVQSIARTLDATKRIRVSVLTSRDVHERQDVENFTEDLKAFLNDGGFTFELELVKIDLPPTTTKPYKVLDINANESNEFIANAIAEMILQ